MTSGAPGNEGIQISGGSIQVGGSLSVGRNAHAESSHVGAGDDTELRAQVEALRASLERNAREIADAAAAMSDLRRIVAELDEPQPQADRVRSLFGRLRDGTGHVAEIATSLATVERLVAAVL